MNTKYILCFLVFLITSCGLTFRGDGGISLVGTIVQDGSERSLDSAIDGCYFDVMSSSGRKVYEKMTFLREGDRVFINLTVAPKPEQYEIIIYCHGKHVKKVITNSGSAETTDMGVIYVSQT